MFGFLGGPNGRRLQREMSRHVREERATMIAEGESTERIVETIGDALRVEHPRAFRMPGFVDPPMREPEFDAQAMREEEERGRDDSLLSMMAGGDVYDDWRMGMTIDGAEVTGEEMHRAIDAYLTSSPLSHREATILTLILHG